MEKLCECGCGKPTPICTHTSSERGWVKGEPQRFISGHNGRARKRSTHCPQGHPLSGDNTILSPSKGVSSQTGLSYRTGMTCRICMKQRTIARRSTPEGKTERALEHLKSRGGLSREELNRAKSIVLDFFRRPKELQSCPICGDNCSGKKQSAVDHNHETCKFRDVICQQCNTALGHSREREDLLGDGKLGQYLKKHQGDISCRVDS